MLNKITTQITNHIKNNSNIKSIDDLEKINYSLQAILGDVFKFIILTLIFLVLGKVNYFLFSVLILFSTRFFIGGYHCKTLTNCLLTSLLIFIITSLLGTMLPKFPYPIYWIISLVSMMIVIIYAPFPNVKRPIKSKKRRQILKLLSIFSLILWLGILIFKIDNFQYLNCGFLTIILEVIQVIPTMKGVNIHENPL